MKQPWISYSSCLMFFLSSCTANDSGKQEKAEVVESKTETIKMQAQNFTSTLQVDQTPKEVFHAINHVRGWWSEEIEGTTEGLNEEFNYHYEDIHRCKMKIIEFVPEKKVVWLVEENYFKFTKDKTEWTGTKIIFDISKSGDKTQIQFTHLGLVPEYECFEICKEGWTNYIQKSLRLLITEGKGQPNGKDKPQTKSEMKFSAESKQGKKDR